MDYISCLFQKEFMKSFWNKDEILFLNLFSVFRFIHLVFLILSDLPNLSFLNTQYCNYLPCLVRFLFLILYKLVKFVT